MRCNVSSIKGQVQPYSLSAYALPSGPSQRYGFFRHFLGLPRLPFRAYLGPPRNVAPIDNLAFDPKLQPREYHVSGTSSTSKILILDVNIVEATGREPYCGHVLRPIIFPQDPQGLITYNK